MIYRYGSKVEKRILDGARIEGLLLRFIFSLKSVVGRLYFLILRSVSVGHFFSFNTYSGLLCDVMTSLEVVWLLTSPHTKCSLAERVIIYIVSFV